MSIEVGTILPGKVTGITNFGAFVDLGNRKTGLVHISEVSNSYIKDIKDASTVSSEESSALARRIDKLTFPSPAISITFT